MATIGVSRRDEMENDTKRRQLLRRVQELSERSPEVISQVAQLASGRRSPSGGGSVGLGHPSLYQSIDRREEAMKDLELRNAEDSRRMRNASFDRQMYGAGIGGDAETMRQGRRQGKIDEALRSGDEFMAWRDALARKQNMAAYGNDLGPERRPAQPMAMGGGGGIPPQVGQKELFALQEKYAKASDAGDVNAAQFYKEQIAAAQARPAQPMAMQPQQAVIANRRMIAADPLVNPVLTNVPETIRQAQAMEEAALGPVDQPYAQAVDERWRRGVTPVSYGELGPAPAPITPDQTMAAPSNSDPELESMLEAAKAKKKSKSESKTKEG